MQFEIHQTDKESRARAGLLQTGHGAVETPVFMPVGTAATVKGVQFDDLAGQLNCKLMLSNTYHLNLRPGPELLERAGGIHRFMNWNGAVLTDSGGYQVFSLAAKRKLDESGVHFRSHIDGSPHHFTPESTIALQRQIGADIIMVLDECTPYPCDRAYAENSMHLTHRWEQRCVDAFEATPALYGYPQALFPIVQGSVYPELRKQSSEFVAGLGMVGNAIGGLSVGEPDEDLYSMTDLCCSILPADKPRYLMGVGTPGNLLECIALGVDMFDCVMPTRNARNGMLFTRGGIINIRNKKWEDVLDPIDAESQASTSRNHTKAYLRHLFMAKEMLGPQIATLNNLSLYLWLMAEARHRIVSGDFSVWKDTMVKTLMTRL